MEPRGRVMAHPCGSITTRVYKDRLFSRRGLSVDQDGDNNSCWDRISQVRPSMRFNWNDEDWSSWGGKDGFAEVLYLDEIQHLLSKGWGNSTYRTKLFPPYSVGNFLVQKYLQSFKEKRLFLRKLWRFAIHLLKNQNQHKKLIKVWIEMNSNYPL